MTKTAAEVLKEQEGRERQNVKQDVGSRNHVLRQSGREMSAQSLGIGLPQAELPRHQHRV